VSVGPSGVDRETDERDRNTFSGLRFVYTTSAETRDWNSHSESRRYDSVPSWVTRRRSRIGVGFGRAFGRSVRSDTV